MSIRSTKIFSAQTILFLTALLTGPLSYAEINEEMDSLGGNEALLEQAKELNPESRIKVVQNRLIDLTSKFEIAPEFGGTFGGDAYNRSRNVGLNAYFHINPHWAIGARGDYFFNELTPEGKTLVDQAERQIQADPTKSLVTYPKIDYPKSQFMALVNWYPIYGKLSWYDLGVTHFDFYTIAGYGQINMQSGSKPTYTVGGGVGLWWSQKLTTRLEMRYQNYVAEAFGETRSIDATTAGVQLGWVL